MTNLDIEKIVTPEVLSEEGIPVAIWENYLKDGYKESIARYIPLKRLKNNPDFKFLIEDEFLTVNRDEALKRLYGVNDRERSPTVDSLVAVSNLLYFFDEITFRYNSVKEQIPELIQIAEATARAEAEKEV
jgi:hypothetical protein